MTIPQTQLKVAVKKRQIITWKNLFPQLLIKNALRCDVNEIRFLRLPTGYDGFFCSCWEPPHDL